MRLPRRRFSASGAGAAVLPAASRIALAQTAPSRPITMIVAFPPGGPTDVVGRIMAERMKISGVSDKDSPPIEMSKMIKNFGDHSSNERTFLAWVRTAIAVMAFGFIVEKFDLFLELAAPSLAGRTLSLPGQKFGNAAGLALIILGTAMVAVAATRFLITARNIDSEDLRHGAGSRIDVALAALLVLLGSALFLYLSRALVATG